MILSNAGHEGIANPSHFIPSVQRHTCINLLSLLYLCRAVFRYRFEIRYRKLNCECLRISNFTGNIIAYISRVRYIHKRYVRFCRVRGRKHGTSVNVELHTWKICTRCCTIIINMKVPTKLSFNLIWGRLHQAALDSFASRGSNRERSVTFHNKIMINIAKLIANIKAYIFVARQQRGERISHRVETDGTHTERHTFA
jgi:hypothetical protein